MHIFSRRSGAVALLVAAAAVMPAACATNDSSIAIRGMLAVSRTDCTFQLSTTSEIDLAGEIDAAYAGEFVAVLLVENQMVPLGNPSTVMTETDSVQLSKAEVQVLDAQGNVLSEFSQPVAGFIDPSQGGTAGLGASQVVLLDAATVQSEAKLVETTGVTQQVVSSVIIEGQTLGGNKVHTQDFLFPITIVVGGTCVAGMSGPCVGGTSSSSMGDCSLGVNEPAGTSCQAIAMQIGVCGKLECTTPHDPLTAQCPSHVPPDDSCCPL